MQLGLKSLQNKLPNKQTNKQTNKQNTYFYRYNTPTNNISFDRRLHRSPGCLA